MLIATELNQLIPNILRNLNREFSTNAYSNLLSIYYRISTMPRYKNVQHLKISNYDPKKTWKTILELCIDIMDRAFLKNPKETMDGLIYTLDRIVNFHEIELISEAKIEKNKKIDMDYMKTIIEHYHEIYEGRYKFLLAFFVYTVDIYLSSAKKELNKYFEDDVSYLLKKVKKYIYKKIYIDTIDWLSIGADENIRNAIAHKSIIYREMFAIFSDKKGWREQLNFIEFEDILRNLKIVCNAMEAGLIITQAKHKTHIPPSDFKKDFDEHDIKNGIIFNIKNYKFELLEYQSYGKLLKLKIKDGPRTHGSSQIMGQMGRVNFSANLPPEPPRRERILAIIINSMAFIWKYENVKIDVINFLDEPKGTLEIDLKKWSDLYFSDEKNYKKEDFDNCVTEINFKEN